MKKLAVFLAILFSFSSPVLAITSRVNLLTADGFAILGGSAISNTPTSTISGDVGLSPTGGTAITGLTCAEITGTLYDTNGGYTGGGGGSTACRLQNASLLTAAKNDATTASNDASGRSTTSTVATELGGSTLTDGVYDSAAGTFGITGTLTLNGQGNADSVFIFKMASTLITASASKVVLTNSAQGCNVYWVVGSSATFGTSSTFIGTVLASASITDNGASTINGRLLASTGGVTLNNTTVTKPSCAAGTSGGAALPTSVQLNQAPGVGYCPPISSQTDLPIIIESKRISPTSIYLKWGPYSGVDTFNVQYGFENNKFIFNTNVTGFSTTINDLPINQPIWVRVATRNDCQIGTYGESSFTGSPKLPNTGFAPKIKNWFFFWL